jgi:hypothetical protein
MVYYKQVSHKYSYNDLYGEQSQFGCVTVLNNDDNYYSS